VLVVWIYYTFAVILFGAELLANTRRREALLLARLLEERKPGAASVPFVPSRFVRSFEPGEVIFEEDSRGREMFYILSGAVRILKKGKLLREMSAGDYFGEMAMLIQAPRTAAAVAAAPDTGKPAARPRPGELAKWIRGLKAAEKDALLLSVAQGKGTSVEQRLVSRFQQAHAKTHRPPTAARKATRRTVEAPRRTVDQLMAAWHQRTGRTRREEDIGGQRG